MEHLTTFTLAASGDPYASNPPEVFEVTVTLSTTWTLSKIRDYFVDRIGELESDCGNGTPWVFINAAVMLEYLSNLVVDPSGKTDCARYLEFINGDWLPAAYKDFLYNTEHDGLNGPTRQDLPLQMYCVLRSAMVHSFSMIPDSTFWSDHKRASSTSPTKYARRGSIVICHASSRNEHLSNFKTQDAACFVAEPFVADIRAAIEKIFATANNDESLRERIEQVVNARPPLGLVYQL